MSYKVVRKGNIVLAFGPNTSEFQPVIEEGAVLTTEESIPVEVTTSQNLQRYEIALDNYLDSVARQDRWTNRFTFVARAAYPNPWQQKAIAFGTWMDICNVQAYQLMQQVQANEVQIPSIEEFIAGLPAFNYVES